jgi:predicted ArsR family transcriptional regulator
MGDHCSFHCCYEVKIHAGICSLKRLFLLASKNNDSSKLDMRKSMRELVREATSQVPDKIPEGRQTREQWGVELGIERNKLARALKKLVEDGSVGMEMLRGEGMCRKIPHYWRK